MAQEAAHARVRSAREVYASTCVDLNCKCNSALERMLPGDGDDPAAVGCIDLSLNLVGNLGCQALLPALAQLPALTALNLARNQIENACATALAARLASHPTLTLLDLTANPISHAGGKQLLQLAMRSQRLRFMELEDTMINPALRKRIEAALAARRHEEAENGDASPTAPGAATAAPSPTPARVNDAPEEAAERDDEVPAAAAAASAADDVDGADATAAAAEEEGGMGPWSDAPEHHRTERDAGRSDGVHADEDDDDDATDAGDGAANSDRDDESAAAEEHEEQDDADKEEQEEEDGDDEDGGAKTAQEEKPARSRQGTTAKSKARPHRKAAGDSLKCLLALEGCNAASPALRTPIAVVGDVAQRREARRAERTYRRRRIAAQARHERRDRGMRNERWSRHGRRRHDYEEEVEEYWLEEEE